VAFKEDIEASASYCPQTARGPQSNMKRTSKYDELQFGSEPKDASNYGLDMMQELARKGKKRTHLCRPMNQHLLDQV